MNMCHIVITASKNTDSDKSAADAALLLHSLKSQVKQSSSVQLELSRWASLQVPHPEVVILTFGFFVYFDFNLKII